MSVARACAGVCGRAVVDAARLRQVRAREGLSDECRRGGRQVRHLKHLQRREQQRRVHEGGGARHRERPERRDPAASRALACAPRGSSRCPPARTLCLCCSGRRAVGVVVVVGVMVCGGWGQDAETGEGWPCSIPAQRMPLGTWCISAGPATQALAWHRPEHECQPGCAHVLWLHGFITSPDLTLLAEYTAYGCGAARA